MSNNDQTNDAVDTCDVIDEGDIVIRWNGSRFGCSAAGMATLNGVDYFEADFVGYGSNLSEALADWLRLTRRSHPHSTSSQPSQIKFDNLERNEISFDGLENIQRKRWWKF